MIFVSRLDCAYLIMTHASQLPPLKGEFSGYFPGPMSPSGEFGLSSPSRYINCSAIPDCPGYLKGADYGNTGNTPTLYEGGD